MSNNVLVKDLVGIPPYLRTLFGDARAVRALTGTVDFTDDGTPVVIGQITEDDQVLGVFVEVAVAFDGSSTDLLDVGTNTDPDGFTNDVDLSSTGTAFYTGGALIGTITTSDQVELLYTDDGGDAAAGEAHVAVFYLEG